MSQCTDRYLSLCATPTPLGRDGYTGANAHIYLPFCGFVFFSGATIEFGDSTIPQYVRRSIGGVTMPDTFNKGDSGVCSL